MKSSHFFRCHALSFGLLFLASLPAGAQSGALQFDGTDDYVTFGPASGLGASAFTLETWFKQTGPGVATSTGSGGVTAAVPLLTKGRSEADGSTVDMNWFLGLAGDKLCADFEAYSDGQNHPVIDQKLELRRVDGRPTQRCARRPCDYN